MLPEMRAKQWRDWGRWEVERLESLYLNLSQGDILLEIGAEEGDFAALASTWGVRVMLMEPSPVMWPNIREIFEKNNLEKPLACFAGFASNRTNLSKSNYDPKIKNGWPACAFNENTADRSFRHMFDHLDITDEITVDDFVRKSGVVPNAISIDVEGSEWNVIRGMERLLDDHDPLVYVSIHHSLMAEKYGMHFVDIYSLFSQHGYKPYFLGYDHEAHYCWYKKSLRVINEIVN